MILESLQKKETSKAMSPIIQIEPTEPAHIAELKANIREKDACEILRFGIPVHRGIWRTYRNALLRRTAFIDGFVAAVWGCNGSFLGKTGTPWLFTTPQVEKISPLRFARIYQQEVANMLEIWPQLSNYVDAEYEAAIRLLDIVGFTIGEPEPLGFKGALYRKFEMGV